MGWLDVGEEETHRFWCANCKPAELQADENGKPAKKPAVRIKYPIEDKDLKKSDRADEVGLGERHTHITIAAPILTPRLPCRALGQCRPTISWSLPRMSRTPSACGTFSSPSGWWARLASAAPSSPLSPSHPILLLPFRTELRLSPFTFRAFQQAITHEGKEACPLLAHGVSGERAGGGEGSAVRIGWKTGTLTNSRLFRYRQ